MTEEEIKAYKEKLAKPKAVKAKQELAKIIPNVMEMILKKSSKIALIKVHGSLTITKVLKGDFPTVGQLIREHGEERMEKAVSILIHDLASSFDQKLAPEVTEEIYAEITASYLRNLSLEDFYVILREIKTSDSFGKLTVNKVLKAVEKYFKRRCDEAERINHNRHLSGKYVDNQFKDSEQNEVREAHRIAQERFLRENHKEAE